MSNKAKSNFDLFQFKKAALSHPTAVLPTRNSKIFPSSAAP